MAVNWKKTLGFVLGGPKALTDSLGSALNPKDAGDSTQLKALRQQNALKKASMAQESSQRQAAVNAPSKVSTPPAGPVGAKPTAPAKPVTAVPPQMVDPPVAPVAPVAPVTPQMPPTAPTAPVAPPAPTDYKTKKAAYQASLAPSKEQADVQAQIDALKARNAEINAASGVQSADLSGQKGVVSPIINAQQQALQRMTAAQTGVQTAAEEPLIQKLARIQSAATATQAQAKEAMTEAAPQTETVSAGSTVIDKTTGNPIYAAPNKPSEPTASIQDYQYARSQGYAGSYVDYQRDIAAAKASVSPASTPTSYDEYTRTTTTPTPEGYAAFLASKKGVAGQSSPEAIAFQKKTNERTLVTVDEALGKVNGYTTGIGAATLGMIPGNDAYNFARVIDTLKANIAFGTLQDMRNASKTGGALGQVSDREEMLLSSVLGSLDPKQSAEQIKHNLQQIKDSITRWNEALASQETEQPSAEDVAAIKAAHPDATDAEIQEFLDSRPKA